MKKTIEVPIGGELRACRLGIGELRQLQDKCNAGPATIFARLVSYQPQAADFRQPRPEDFALGLADPDYLAQMNLFSILRSIGGDWRVDDIRETIRLGLLGGGMDSASVYVLVMTEIDNRPGALVGLINQAAEILHHAIANDPDDPVGKNQAETQSPTATDA